MVNFLFPCVCVLDWLQSSCVGLRAAAAYWRTGATTCWLAPMMEGVGLERLDCDTVALSLDAVGTSILSGGNAVMSGLFAD